MKKIFKHEEIDEESEKMKLLDVQNEADLERNQGGSLNSPILYW